MREIHLQGADNVRDLGGVPVRGNRAVAPGFIFRGSALEHITAEDRHELFGRLGIGCVVDLRCGWELEAKPDLMPADVEYLHIPFYDLEKVGIEYTEPAEGTKVVGRDVACDPDRFYRSLANPLTVGQMREGIDQVFCHVLGGVPVYVHCSGGKDRAGILSALILRALGASPDDILADYLLTNDSRDKHFDQLYERFFGFTGDDGRARELVRSHRARPENLDAFAQAVTERYGSMDAFMRNQLGIDEERSELLRKCCTVGFGEGASQS